MPSLKHKFTSLKADGGDATFVRPSNWNDDHDLVSDGASMYLGRDATGSGDVQELPVQGTGGGDSGTIYTKAAVDAAIAAAIATVQPFDTGDLTASLAVLKQGWALCNGQPLFIGNGPSNHALFVLLWNINGGTWPVSGGRGASAEADWLAGKQIAVPDARGCVFGMVDLGLGVNALIANLAVRVGADKASLDITNIPSHTHTLPFPANVATSSGLGGSGGGDMLNQSGSLQTNGSTGGDPSAAPPFSVPVPVNLTQPTMGAYIFVKL